MKILNPKQIRAADKYTIQEEPIASIDLMERAAKKCTRWIMEHVKERSSIYIFCGPGNNGGDGLAMARQLKRARYAVKVFYIETGAAVSEDFKTNLKYWFDKKGEISKIKSAKDLPKKIEKEVLLVDAILGSGLSRPITGGLKKIVTKINGYSNTKVAIDIPTGLFAESNEANDRKAIIKADFTLTFQTPKLAFLLLENEKFVGDWEVLDIGLHPIYLEKVKTKNIYTILSDAAELKQPRGKFSHKGDFGHVLVAAGAKGKMGAAVLSTKAALKSGAGLVTAHVVKTGVNILQTAVPEAMVLANAGEDFLQGKFAKTNCDVLVMGPGIGTGAETEKFVYSALKKFQGTVILDADALIIVAKNPGWLRPIPLHAIVTPHLGEFERMVGKWKSDTEKLRLQRKFAKKYDCTVVLKGAHTSICGPDGVMYFNSSGNPGMATGGSGDVLAGIIGGLVAQKYDPIEAAVLGVFWHGLAGDIAAQEEGQLSMTACDIIKHMGFAMELIEAGDRK